MPRVGAYQKMDPELRAKVERHEISTVVPIVLIDELYKGPQTFTADDLAQRAGVRQSSVYRWLYTLEEYGLVERHDTVRTLGPRQQVWRRVHRLQPLERPRGI